MKNLVLKFPSLLLALVACVASIYAQQAQTVVRRKAQLDSLDLVRPTEQQTAPTTPHATGKPPAIHHIGAPSIYDRQPAPTENNCKVIWSVSMGTLPDCDCAEVLQLNEDSITRETYTPAALIYSPPGLGYKEGYRADVEVARNPDQSLRQVHMPPGLTDIIVINEWEYEIRFYRPSQVGAKANGIYAVSGAPFAYYIIRNPDPPNVNRLQIIKVKDGVRDVSEYVYDASGNTCELSSDNGATLVTKRTEQSAHDPKERTDTFIYRKHDRITSKTVKVYRRFAWGDELVKLIEDADGARLTTTHAYYEERDNSLRYIKIRLTIFPDGSWEEYDYTSVGGYVHKNVIRSGDKNSPRPTL
ncbi:MAG TPA: hypothetical protein VJ842_05285 [Pyrinomonadaceae bacterium]|nr:hypothetical protein [Pyrinomonadaceae bacterium]